MLKNMVINHGSYMTGKQFICEKYPLFYEGEDLCLE
jgi:hypothetical protein